MNLAERAENKEVTQNLNINISANDFLITGVKYKYTAPFCAIKDLEILSYDNVYLSLYELGHITLTEEQIKPLHHKIVNELKYAASEFIGEED